MKYKQHFKTEDIDWQEAHVNSKHNFDVLEGIDKEQRDKGELLWRNFARNVADGYAYYQITKVTKEYAKVEVCRGVCLDEWTDNMLGYECQLPLNIVKNMIAQKDAMAKLFS
tara:strand:+ start:582 stop:917 length:336 start_codon:yes stop_codon:yes gene_type:complete